MFALADARGHRIARISSSNADLDQLGRQRMCRPLANAVHELLQVGAEVLKHQVQARLAVLLQVFHAQQPARCTVAVEVATQGLTARVRARANGSCGATVGGLAHLTMWLLSDSICSSDISRSVVDGTPSSSICRHDEA